ncbi:MAG TPA: glycoside hydrolase family 16 protein [Vicingaceae bacterium]|nr:glycoside hydrolase family 16 protein [Vicingaceae bacterium]
MKTEKIILFITLFCLSNSDLLAQCSLIPPSIKDIPLCNTNPYVLTFENNFNDTTLDLDNWRLDNQPGSLIGSSSHQIYTLDPDNIEVSNGTLKIIANNIAKTRPAIPYLPYNQILDDGLPNERPYQYSSSSIWSKRFFREGKYEIKCRISKGKGLWPAFWLFDGDSSPGGSHWSELDFFEIYYDKESYFNSFKYTNNIHYDLNNDGKTKDEQCSFAMGGIDFSTWHTFTCYFTSDRIDFYIDNTFIHRKVRYFDVNSYYKLCKSYSYKAQAMEQVAWPRSYMNIVLNMAIETGNPPNSQTFPGVFEIDYVRVWERESIPVNCGDIIVKGSPFTGGYLGEWGLLTQNAAVIAGTGVAITVRDKLYIHPNFKAQHGSYFHAKADPLLVVYLPEWLMKKEIPPQLMKDLLI